MSQFRDYEAQVMSVQRGPKMQPIECKTCKCQWFEQVRVSKYDANVIVAPMQALPEAFHSFVLLRCARCSDLQEIPTNLSGWDKTSQDRYGDLTSELEKGPPKKETKNEVPSDSKQ